MLWTPKSRSRTVLARTGLMQSPAAGLFRAVRFFCFPAGFNRASRVRLQFWGVVVRLQPPLKQLSLFVSRVDGDLLRMAVAR